jgi:hypothetical protein
MTTRQVLPNRRYGETFELTHGDKNTVFKITVGYFPESASPAEVFIAGAKAGSEVEAVARDGAVLISLALQHGVPVDILAGAITRESNGAPSTIVGAVLDKLREA